MTLRSSAKDGELPAALEKKIWKEPVEGLLITAAAAALLANLFDISSISMMGSAGFLIIFGAVNLANVRLADRTGSRRLPSLLAALGCGAALAALIWHVARTDPARILVLLVMVGIAGVIEVSYRRLTGRRIRLRP